MANRWLLRILCVALVFGFMVFAAVAQQMVEPDRITQEARPLGQGASHFSDHGTFAQITFSFSWYRLIIPLGITALSLLVLTFLSGWFMRLNRKLLFKWHRRVAIATLVVAVCHMLMVILFR